MGGWDRRKAFGVVGRMVLAATLLLGLAVAIAAPAMARPSGRRIALLIADGRYPEATVATASKDAHLLRDELARAQFDTTLQENADRSTMQAAVDAFTAKITPGTVTLLYFTGIGIQVDRRSYLIPVDAQIASEEDVKRGGLDIDALLVDMERRGAEVKIAIIDGARSNPYERRFRATPAGLAGLDTPGTLALLSTAPGRTSPDDTRDVSLFMGELVKELRSPGISAEEVFAHTRIGVSRASNGDQIPWVASSLLDEFAFGRTADVPAPPQPPVAYAAPPAAAPAASPPAARPQPAPAASAAPPPPAETADIGGVHHIRDCADCPDMVVLPPGGFDMGTRSTPFDRPVHRVTIGQPFAIAATEVTFAQWEACAAAGGCGFRPSDQGWGAGDRPVINVSWSDALQYATWLSKQTGDVYRLPSEAEWEYAARGGHAGAFAWGPAVGVNNANCRDCQAGGATRTLPVRSFPPNGFGLFDMAGNAAEWVEDCWHDTYVGAPRDGSAWTTGNCDLRVLRGGSFDSTSAYIRPAARFRYDADVRYYANGFRVVRNLP